MKKLVIGILAHVDAGKTTLAEHILYQVGKIRTLGRVDHQNAFLDHNQLERERGITIFSKQVQFEYKDTSFTLMDTPGHADFSSEMERVLQVLDYAVLVISGSDGVQGHTETLWRLLSRYQIPTFLFINKMDLQRKSEKELMSELRKHFGDGCIKFNEDQKSTEFMENIALCEERLLNQFIEGQSIGRSEIIRLINIRKVFPCYFGAALKSEGVLAIMEGLNSFTKERGYPDTFGARVFKIGHDEQGNRLTYMKILGGTLKVKAFINHNKTNEEFDPRIEKVDQIRVYSGAKYELRDVVEGGEICAVTGLTKTYPGEGLGFVNNTKRTLLEPVLSYQIILPKDCEASLMLRKLRVLEEEDPQLQIIWIEQLREIHVKLMGEVQIDVLKRIILDRFGVLVDFSQGKILYKETIRASVLGMGHFEPLRHYAEVLLLLEPNDCNAGLEFHTNCSEDMLDANWQNLILSHMQEKEQPGVLMGAPITDIKFTLLAGRAHPKHTEGGDFRQATYRAIRQGLKKAENILLEPYYEYKMELPKECIGRAISDIQKMYGDYKILQSGEETTILSGKTPVVTMMGYQKEVLNYTKGRGKLFVSPLGYYPCHNTSEVLSLSSYDSERDLQHPTGSIFCDHGSGFFVGWDRVEEYMHISCKYNSEAATQKNSIYPVNRVVMKEKQASDKELEEIFIRTYGPIKNKAQDDRNRLSMAKSVVNEGTSDIKTSNVPVKIPDRKEYLLVDGYNIIFAWEELKELADINLDSARSKLMDILCNYQGYRKCKLILVFDAYKVKGGTGELVQYHNIDIVYTREAETADQYIEKVTHNIARKNHVTVATSDALQQMIILGDGAIRMSANEFRQEVININHQMREKFSTDNTTGKVYLREQIDKITED